MTRIRGARRARGMTLAEMSFRAEVDEAFLSKLERGFKRANRGMRKRVAGVLGVEEGVIFDADGTPVT